MAATTPTTEPAQIRAGETLHFLKSLADYKAADGWSITYNFRGLNGSAIDFTTSANGDDHEATVAFSETVQWLPGVYQGVGLVTDGTTKTQVWAGQLTVLPNLSALSAGTDTRSQARRTLDNINAVIEGRASSSILNSTVEGTQLQRIPFSDLLELQARYKVIVRNEEIAAIQAAGGNTGRTIFNIFTRPK